MAALKPGMCRDVISERRISLFLPVTNAIASFSDGFKKRQINSELDIYIIYIYIYISLVLTLSR